MASPLHEAANRIHCCDRFGCFVGLTGDMPTTTQSMRFVILCMLSHTAQRTARRTTARTGVMPRQGSALVALRVVEESS